MGLGAVGEQRELVWEPPRIRFEHAGICLGARKKRSWKCRRLQFVQIGREWPGGPRDAPTETLTEHKRLNWSASSLVQNWSGGAVGLLSVGWLQTLWAARIGLGAAGTGLKATQNWYFEYTRIGLRAARNRTLKCQNWSGSGCNSFRFRFGLYTSVGGPRKGAMVSAVAQLYLGPSAREARAASGSAWRLSSRQLRL